VVREPVQFIPQADHAADNDQRVENGTAVTQKVVSGTLGQLDILAQQMASPALIIVDYPALFYACRSRREAKVSGSRTSSVYPAGRPRGRPRPV
jgi:hypothetical protein